MAKGYNNRNRLHRIKLVQNLVQLHYEEGISNYKGIWEKYVFPVYPMSYKTFLEYINIAVPKSILTENKAAVQPELFDTVVSTSSTTEEVNPVTKPVTEALEGTVTKAKNQGLKELSLKLKNQLKP